MSRKQSLQQLLAEKKQCQSLLSVLKKNNPQDSKTIQNMTNRLRIIQNDIEAIRYSP